MKKQKPKLPAPDAATRWHPAARKIGESVRFSFLRCIRQEMECTALEAETIFKTAVERGVIVHTGMAGFAKDVPKYKIK